MVAADCDNKCPPRAFVDAGTSTQYNQDIFSSCDAPFSQPDLFPSPVELLVLRSGLGSCLCIRYRLVQRRIKRYQERYQGGVLTRCRKGWKSYDRCLFDHHGASTGGG